MSIHSRRAADEVLDALEKQPDAGIPVLHWFTGTKRQLERAISLGCWFSVGPAMLRSKRGVGLTAAIPRNRVLTETDGPFAMIGDEPLQPSDVMSAVAALARIWNEGLADVEHRLHESLRSLVTSANE